MAKKDVRLQVTLACTECKNRNYITEKNRRNTTALIPDELLGADFRFRVCPCRLHRPVFVDELSRFSRAMHEHRACEHKLLDLKIKLA